MDEIFETICRSTRYGPQSGLEPTINKYVCARTKHELEVKKEEMRRHYINGVAIREDMMFYAEEWYTIRKEPFISEASKSSYRSCFNKHILPAFGLRHLRAIRSAELQAFVNGYNRASKSQITLMIGILKNIISSAYAEGIIDRDPSVALIRPKARKKEARRALTAYETLRVLETIDRHPHGLFLAAIYFLACAVAKRSASNGATSTGRKALCMYSGTSITPAAPPRTAI